MSKHGTQHDVVKLPKHLTEEQREKLIALLGKYPQDGLVEKEVWKQIQTIHRPKKFDDVVDEE